MTTPALATAHRAVTGRAAGDGLDSRTLPVRTWLLLAAGTAGGGGVHRGLPGRGRDPGRYRTLPQPVSALSLGPGGWVQQLNFIVFGVLVCLSAGLATIVFIAVFGASGGHGGLAGLWERAAGARRLGAASGEGA